MENKELVQNLNEALNLLAPIAVSHDAVDFMALAKQKIRMVVAKLEEGKE